MKKGHNSYRSQFFALFILLILLNTSSFVFGESVTISLKQGVWKAFSVPVSITKTEISNYIDLEQIEEIKTYGGSWGQDWGFYKPGTKEDFTNFEAGKGYLAKTKQDVDFSFNGSFTGFPDMELGLNFVCLPAHEVEDVMDLFSKYENKNWEITKIMAYDGNWGPGWGAVTGKSKFDAFTNIESHRGYFVYVKTIGENMNEGNVTQDEFTNSIGMTFKLIKAGTFMMGSPSNESGRGSDEKQHNVTLTKGFYMQTTEITQGQWEAIMGTNPSNFSSCGVNCPVEKISWNDVQDFIEKLNTKEGTTKYRLPTEAEWEYSARAGSQTAFANGGIQEINCELDPNLNAMGWYCGNANGKTHPVAQKQANNWGLYDMHGNVNEWCQDWYDTYPSSDVVDPVGSSSGSIRVIRGGGWGSGAQYCRSANRLSSSPGNRSSSLGARLLRTP